MTTDGMTTEDVMTTDTAPTTTQGVSDLQLIYQNLFFRIIME